MPNTRNCGFFNSNSEGDRPYDAEDISQMMTGMVTGGVFPNVGDKFAVRASGTDVIIGTGKAWWHGKWFENSAEFTISDGASSENDRIDILVIEVNETEEVRDVYFKILEGIPASEPEEPEIVNAGGIYQLPIAKITRLAGDIEIATENLEYLPGTTRSPWVETALDPNKCIYAYEDETEEVEFDEIIIGGVFEFKKTLLERVSGTNYYAFNDFMVGFKENFPNVFKSSPVVIVNYNRAWLPPSNTGEQRIVCVGDTYRNCFALSLAISVDEWNNIRSDETLSISWIATGLVNK